MPKSDHQPKQLGKTPGQILKEVRESKGIALETIHNATKIPLDALKAIEEGYTIRTLSPFYMKGFMKMYAQYIGVDVEDIVSDYHQEQLPQPVQPAYPTDVLEKKVKQVFTRERQQWLVKIFAALVVLFVVVKIGGCIFRRPPGKPQLVTKTQTSSPTPKPAVKEKKKIINPVKKKKPVAVAPIKAVAPKPVAKASPPPLPAPTKNIRLTIRTLKQGWLQVKVDGVLVFQSTIKKGAVESWEADDKIEISGKNIHNLEFELNGKVLGTLGRADRSARRVVITKDGLKVIQ